MTANQSFTHDRIVTPIGTMLVLTDDQHRLRAIDWEDCESRMLMLLRRQYGASTVQVVDGRSPRPVRDAIEAYFCGELTALDALPVATGGTAFQRSVWEALRRIPFGQTRSYGALALGLGNPTAVRAVGLANGANPIGVVVPCHRVIGANRSLTGYGGGLHRKRWLLTHEGAAFRDEPGAGDDASRGRSGAAGDKPGDAVAGGATCS
jgi:methylated-DNA-[protein]-cysteine S-methyltransferase